MASWVDVRQASRVVGLLSRALYDVIGKRLPSWFPPAQKVRRALSRRFVSHVGDRADIFAGVRLSSRLSLGDDSGIGEDSAIYGIGAVTIGNWVRMGPRCLLLTGDHPPPGDDQVFADIGPTTADIVIGDDVFIGAQVTILSGVTIGDGAAIGAGAVVVRDIPPGSVAVGNPAKVVRTRRVGSGPG